MLRYDDIKFDCRLYNGYKPCIYGNHCPGCPHYQPHQIGSPAAPQTQSDNDISPLSTPQGGSGVSPLNNPQSATDIPPLNNPQGGSGVSPLNNTKPTSPSQENPTTPPLSRNAISRLPQDPHILIIKTGALGDVLRTTTLLHPLRRAFPAAHITWITAPAAIPLLSANPLINELVAFDGNTAPALTGRTFHLSICLEKEAFPLTFAREVNAAEKIGYYPTPWNTATIANAEAEYMLLLGIIDELKFHKNQKSYPHIICEATGLPFARDPYILNLTANADAPRQRILRAAAQSPTGADIPLVGLNTGCGAVFRTKQWTLEGWVATARSLIASGKANVVLLGGEAERELNRAIAQQVPQIIDAGTENTLEEFFGIIDACDLVVTSDSLGMHVAIARQKYVVALFGSTSHHEIDLYERGEKIITDFACSPCYLKTCDKSPTCMQAMSSTQVLAAVHRGIQIVAQPAGTAS